MHKPDGILRAVLLALVLALGAAIVWGVAWGFVGRLIEVRRRASQPPTSHEQLLVLQDGTPVISTLPNNSFSERTLRSLDGELRAAGNLLRSANLLGPSQLDRLHLSKDWSFRVWGCSDFITPPAFWYFVHDGRREGRAWFEGFDSVTKQRIGWISREGFRTDWPTADERFAVDGRALHTVVAGRTYRGPPQGDSTTVDAWASGASRARIPPWMIHLVSAGQLVAIDLRGRSVRTVFDDAELISVGVAERVRDGHEPEATAETPVEYLAARGHDCIWIIAPGTGDRRKFPLPQELRDRYLNIYLLQDGLLLTTSEWPMYATAPVEVIWLNEQGKIARRQVVALNRALLRSTNGWLNKVGTVVMLPIPVLLGLIVVVFLPMAAVTQGTAATYSEALGTSLWEFGWFAPPLALLAFALAAWCYRRHRRYGQSGGVVWFVFVLLLGLPGLAGYLLHRRWPVRLPCPSCGRQVPRDRTACSECGAEFPRPAANGSEVFDAP